MHSNIIIDLQVLVTLCSYNFKSQSTHIMRSFKTILFPLIFIIIYIWLIFTVFFWNSDISNFGTTIWLQILLIIVWFLAIQTIPLWSRNTLFRLISLFWLTLSLVAWSTYSIQHAIFIFCTHIIFMVYVRDRFTLVQSSKSFYLWRSSHRGLETTSLLLAFTYIGTLWGASSELNLDCNKIHDQTLGILTRYIPNIQNNTGVINIINKIDTIWSQSFGQLLGINNTLSWDILWETDMSGNNVIIQNNLEILSWLTDILSWTNIILPSTNEQQWWLLWLLWEQKNLLNNIVTNQELIDGKVCAVTLEHINTISQKSEVKLITFILLVWWLSFFLRSIMFIIGIINFIILWFLFQISRFKKTIVQEECEKIDV